MSAVIPPPQPDNGYASLYPDDPRAVPPVQPAAPVPPAAPYQPHYQQQPPPRSPYQQPYQAPAAYTAPPAYDERVYEEPARRPLWPWLVGAAALVAVALAAYGFLNDGPSLQPLDDKTLAEQSSEAAATAEEPTIIKPAESLYISADANVRDKPTISGTKIVGKLTRGTAVTGDVVAGNQGQRWLRLTGKEHYISLVNLSETPMPALASMSNSDMAIVNRCPMQTWPTAESPVKVTLKPGNKVKLIGLTGNGYAEFSLPQGGVGYVPREGQPCLAGADAEPIEAPDDFIPPSHIDDEGMVEPEREGDDG